MVKLAIDSNKPFVKKDSSTIVSVLKFYSIPIRLLLFITFTAGAWACGKDKNKPSPSPVQPMPGYTFTCEDTTLDWSTQIFDTDFGQNALYYGKWSVWRMVYDPFDYNIVYYLTNEQTGNKHHLWRYNRTTKSKTHITQGVMNNISIGSNGWIAFESQFNIYKIKTNGDSLIQLSFNGALQPRWTEDCKSIYFIEPTNGEVYKYDNIQNIIVDTLKSIYSEVVPYENFLYYLTYDMATEIMRIVKRNMDDNVITTIVERGGPNDHTGESISYWFIDKEGRNLYWSGDHGLSVTNLFTLQTKRVINSGRGSHTWFYYYNRSSQNGQIIATCLVDSVVNTLLRHQKYYTWEFSSDGKCRRKVELPD